MTGNLVGSAATNGNIALIFKMRHPSVHTVSDGAEICGLQLSGGSKKWAFVAKETTEVIYLISWILCTGLSILGTSIALNALTHAGPASPTFRPRCL